MISASGEAVEFLLSAAELSGRSVAEIMDSVLAMRSATDHPEFQRFHLDSGTIGLELLSEVDRRVRLWNPGASLVFRDKYIGYRRFDGRRADPPHASRSDVFASVLPRATFVRLLVPLDPGRFTGCTQLVDLTGKGHHGIGDAAFDMVDSDDVSAVMNVLAFWLGPNPAS